MNFSYFDGRRPLAFDVSGSYDVVPLTDQNEKQRTLRSDLRFYFPLSEDRNHSYLIPGLGVKELTYQGTTRYLELKLGASHDTQFKDIGYSFPETGRLLSGEFSQLLASPETQPLRHHCAHATCGTINSPGQDTWCTLRRIWVTC